VLFNCLILPINRWLKLLQSVKLTNYRPEDSVSVIERTGVVYDESSHAKCIYFCICPFRTMGSVHNSSYSTASDKMHGPSQYQNGKWRLGVRLSIVADLLRLSVRHRWFLNTLGTNDCPRNDPPHSSCLVYRIGLLPPSECSSRSAHLFLNMPLSVVTLFHRLFVCLFDRWTPSKRFIISCVFVARASACFKDN